MSKKKNQEDILSDVLNTESDRGCVLVGASILDNMLEKVIKHNLFLGATGARKEAVNSLFEVNGPLSTFWSRIQFGYAIGIIKNTMYHDLEVIRKLRNEVAHNIYKIDFSNKKISNKTESLILANTAAARILDSKISAKKSPKAISESNHAKNVSKPPKKLEKSLKERARFSLTVGWIAGYLSALIIPGASLPLDLLKRLGEKE